MAARSRCRRATPELSRLARRASPVGFFSGPRHRFRPVGLSDESPLGGGLVPRVVRVARICCASLEGPAFGRRRVPERAPCRRRVAYVALRLSIRQYRDARGCQTGVAGARPRGLEDAMHPYATLAYAKTLGHVGQPFHVPEWRSHVIVRD